LEEQPEGKIPVAVSNPHKLTIDELADHNIQLWMDLKTNIRKYGSDNPKIFHQEIVR